MGRKVCGCGTDVADILIKVLVTGGTGFIGQYCLSQLHEKGYEVHAVSSAPRESTVAVQWHHASLLDGPQTRALIRLIKPSHLLHLAWYTKHVKYWNSPENLNWVQSSLALIQEFTKAGGERLVCAGSCAEYDWGHGTCVEDLTPLAPTTPYGTYKYALGLMLNTWCQQTGLSSAWGRVFSIYGPAEHPQRLVASVIRALLKREVVTCANPSLIRDYLHAEDVASAFVRLCESRLEGAVNVGSGTAVTLRDLVETIAAKLDGRRLVNFGGSQATSKSEPQLLLPDITRLISTGWKKRLDLDGGLDDTINWWKAQALSSPAQ